MCNHAGRSARRATARAFGVFIITALGISFLPSGCWAQDRESVRDVSAMIQGYSQRAKRVLFIARIKAGEMGATTVAVEHLLMAIVIEDQGGEEASRGLTSNAPVVGSLRGRTSKVRQHTAFFSTDVASRLLKKFEDLSPHAQSVPTGQDMSLSPEVGRTLESAQELRQRFKAEEVEPLHILAAVLQERSNSAVQIVLFSGISREQVIKAIGNTE
jgi:ATP-dependent Clp protease ATP-binding subunit ClpC